MHQTFFVDVDSGQLLEGRLDIRLFTKGVTFALTDRVLSIEEDPDSKTKVIMSLGGYRQSHAKKRRGHVYRAKDVRSKNRQARYYTMRHSRAGHGL